MPKMKYFIVSIIAIFLFSGCSEQSELNKKFNCNSTIIKYPKAVTDFNKNFKITISNSWKTKLYFNEFESEIFTADTVKQLTETFILGVSFNTGSLNFDDEFYMRTDSVLTKNNLKTLESGNQLFQSKPAYWYVVKGSKNGFTYHQFNLTAIQSKNTYFNASSEIYGDNNINERICETISILENLEFLE